MNVKVARGILAGASADMPPRSYSSLGALLDAPPATVVHECRSAAGVIRPAHEFDRDGNCFFCPVDRAGVRKADTLAELRLREHIDQHGREAVRRKYENWRRAEYGE